MNATNTECPYTNEYGRFTVQGQMIYDGIGKIIESTRRDPDFPYETEINKLTHGLDMTKFKINAKFLLCDHAIGVDGLFVFIAKLFDINLREYNMFESVLNADFLLNHAVHKCDVQAFEFLLGRGWKFCPHIAKHMCPVEHCLMSDNKNKLNMLEALLKAGVVPSKGFNDLIAEIEIAIATSTATAIDKENLRIIVDAIPILRRYSN